MYISLGIIILAVAFVLTGWTVDLHIWLGFTAMFLLAVVWFWNAFRTSK